MSDYEDNSYEAQEEKQKKKLTYGSKETQGKYEKLQKGLNKYSAPPQWMERIRNIFSPRPKDQEQGEE